MIICGTDCLQLFIQFSDICCLYEKIKHREIIQIFKSIHATIVRY